MGRASERMDEEQRQLYRVFLEARHFLRQLDERPSARRGVAFDLAGDLRKVVEAYDEGEQSRRAERAAEEAAEAAARDIAAAGKAVR